MIKADMETKPSTIVKNYYGDSEKAPEEFEAHAVVMAKEGYYPISTSWADGSYSPLNFFVALMLCLIVIGGIALLFMLLVKPAGTLTVIYEYRPKSIQ